MNLFSNKYLIGALGIVVILQILAVYTAPFNKFLNTTPITLSDWVMVVGVAISVIFVDEIYKLIKASFNRFKSKNVL